MKKSQRPDLVYRNMVEDDGGAPMDGITRMVIEYLAKTPIDEWEDKHWRSFQTLITTNARAPLRWTAALPSQRQMRADALKEMLKEIPGDDP